MSGWVVVEADEGEEHCEILYRDDRTYLGMIIRFEQKGPSYAHTYRGRIGACQNDTIAKQVVEEALCAF